MHFRHLVPLLVVAALAGTAWLLVNAAARPPTASQSSQELVTPASSAAQPAVFVLAATVTGLEGTDTGTIRLVSVPRDGSGDVTTVTEQRVGNGPLALRYPALDDGLYELRMEAPPAYFRDPAGYDFVVESGHAVIRPDIPIAFTLVSPVSQDLPPCRVYAAALPDPDQQDSSTPAVASGVETELIELANGKVVEVPVYAV